MTVVEAIVALGLSAALAIAVAQAAVVSARVRATVQQRAAGLLAAGNALERLRATHPQSLEETAEALRGEVAGLPGGRMEILLSDTTIGDTAAREIRVEVFERPEIAPLVLLGWQIAAVDEGADEGGADDDQ